MKQQFFAPCPRGLEQILSLELSELGAGQVAATDGGVQFAGSMELAYRANLHSRIASRILWRICIGRYQNENDLYQAAYAQPWSEWFSPELTIKVNLSATHSPLRSLDFATLKIKDAICDKFRKTSGSRPSIDTANPDIRVHAHLTENEFSLYLDTSGEALFKRGLRQTAGEAPLRENLAAGILHLAGWKPGIPLLDPMCGSGTFLLEAAQMSLNIAPGINRDFAFMKLLNFDRSAWEAIRGQARGQQQVPRPLPIYGSDLLGRAVQAARINLSDAGLESAVELKQANFLEITAPADHGILVTNPPYGVRLGEQQQLAELYPKIGDTLKRKFAGWNAYLFTADMRLPKLMRLSASRRTPLYNGALECRLFEYKIIAGGMRKPKD